MNDKDREIQELLVDYAGALRDGCIPTFLKSLTRAEAQRIASAEQFADDTEMVRILNSIGFADKAVTPNVSLFTSRVDAKIVSRLKKSFSPPQSRQSRHRSDAKPVSREGNKAEKSI